MEKKSSTSTVKTEDVVGSSSSFPCYNSNGFPFSNGFDFSEVEKSSLGFMELLGQGVQDYGSLLDLPQLSTMPSTVSVPHHQTATVKAPSDDAGKECSSEVLNQQPATPNSSSISSTSSEAAVINDEQNKTVDQTEDDEHNKTKKQWVFFFSFYLFNFFIKAIFCFVQMGIFLYFFQFLLLFCVLF